MAKLWLIQLPAKSRGKVSWGGCSRRNSPACHGPDARIAGHALIERAEEGDAAVGVILPAVLAVEDHRDERRRVVPAGVADRVQLAQEIARGGRPGTALVVEPDLVRHRMVAEDERQLVIALARLPGPVEQLGMPDVAPAVAPDLAAGGTAQDLLVGGDPLDAVASQSGTSDWQTEPSLGHMPRGRASRTARCGSRPRGGRGSRRLPGNPRGSRAELTSGMASRASFLSSSKGQDRVVIGRGRQLDLPALGQRAMQRDDLAQQRALLVEQPLLLFLGVMPPLGLELGELRVLLEEQGVDPGQVRPDLKVAEVASRGTARAPGRPDRPRTPASCTARDTGDAGGSSSRRRP